MSGDVSKLPELAIIATDLAISSGKSPFFQTIQLYSVVQ